MTLRHIFGLISVGCVFHLGLAAHAQTPPEILSGVRIESSGERTSQDRVTRRLSSVVEITIENTGDRLLEPPFHAVVTFSSDADGGLVGLTTTGLQGGLGKDPHQAFFGDLSASIGAGLAPGAKTTFGFSFSRPPTLPVRYAITIHAVRNADPVVAIGGPYAGLQDIAVAFDGSGSSDPDGDPLQFEWDFGDGTSAVGASPSHAYASPGLYEVSLTLADGRGGLSSRQIQVPVSPPGVFALGRTRTLDGNGHPLGRVTVSETGPNGLREIRSDSSSGFVSLGGLPGAHQWKFSRSGYLTGFRRAELLEGQVLVVPFPWLAPLETERFPLSDSQETTVRSRSGEVTLVFPPLGSGGGESVALSDLHGQSLPFPLPFGWSPLRSFHLEMPDAIEAGLSTELGQPVALGSEVILIRFDPDSLEWRTVRIMPGNGTTGVGATLQDAGTYSLVVADTLPGGNPPAAVVGQSLPAGVAPLVAAEVSATGKVALASRVASLDPESVTAMAEVMFVNAGQPLASGAWFLGDVGETYDLRDGGALKTPDYDITFHAYQQPGDDQPATATSRFPLRPRLLFTPDELSEAHIRVDVRAPGLIRSGILAPGGGVLSLEGLRIEVPSGAVGAPAAAEIRAIRLADLARFLGGFEPSLAFELRLPEMLAGSELKFLLSRKLAPDTNYVLARCVGVGAESGLQPVLRLHADAEGQVSVTEPGSGPRLPGITGSGSYVVVRLSEPEGLVEGTVLSPGDDVLDGAIVRVGGEGWLAVSDAAGRFALLSKPGEGTASGINPVNGDGGVAGFSLADATDRADLIIRTAPTGPRVVKTTPPAGELKAVPTVPLRVEFSEPISPGSFGGDGVQLRLAGGSVVAGSLSLDRSNRGASFLPINPLEFGTDYEIVVSAGLVDLQGLPVEGPLVFPFRTVSRSARSGTAELVIHEPGASDVPAEVLAQLVGYQPGIEGSLVVAHGGPGLADSEVPVILVNESTQETATVLSKPDGSFSGFIRADEEDFISAVVVNANGTQVTVPASRQQFDDGRVGLYRQGGILEAESDGLPFELTIPPASVSSRVRFRMDPVPLDRVLEELEGSLPEIARPLGAVSVAHDADQDLSGAADISFPLDRASLVLPPGVDRPEDATFLLTRVMELEDGSLVYEVLDTMRPEGDRLITNSPPYSGLLFKRITGKTKVFSSSFTALKKPNKILSLLGLPGIQETITHQLLLPFMMAIGGTTTDVIGNAYAVEVDANGNEVGERKAVAGAVIGLSAPPISNTGGGFRPGTFVTTSREGSGFFVLRSDVTLEGAAFLVSATHPRFPNQRPSAPVAVGSLGQRFSQGDIFKTELLFRTIQPSAGGQGPDSTPPQVRVASSPSAPSAGLDSADGADLFVATLDDQQVVGSTLSVIDATGLGGGAIDIASDVQLSESTTLQSSANRIEERYHLRCARAGRVTLVITATDVAGNVSSVTHVVDFSRPPVHVPSGESNGLAPRVMFAWPPLNAVNQPAFPEIRLRFSEPIPAEFFQTGGSDWLQFASPHFVTSITAGPDSRDVIVRFAGEPGGQVSLSVGSPLTDAEGDAFDQNPDEDGAQTFAHSFGLATAQVGTLGLSSGGGVVGAGARMFALDRTNSNTGRLVCYDVGNPAAPVEVGSFALPSRPADLVYLPAYSFRRTQNAPVETKDLVVAVGGVAGAAGFGEASFAFKWLRVIDVTDAANPSRVAGVILSQDPTSLIFKLSASPPVLVYQENAGDVTALNFVDLPALIIGSNASAAEKANFPLDYQPGKDLNNDGDFGDPGEIGSLPAQSGLFFGHFFSFAPERSRDRIVDFAVGKGGLTSVVTFDLDTKATTLRNALAEVGTVGTAPGSLEFPDQEAKRVSLIEGVLINRPEGLRLLDLALISMRPTGSSGGRLEVVDVSDPLAPVSIGHLLLDAQEGTPQSVILREDGSLALATTSGLLILDPSRLLEMDASGNSLAVIGRVPGLGGGVRAFVSSASGIDAVNAGGNQQVAFSGPSFSVVTFPGAPKTAGELAGLSESAVAQLIASAARPGFLRSARIDFGAAAGPEEPLPPPSPPLADDHYYVLCRMPGGASGDGNSLPLLAATVNGTGEMPKASDGSVLPSLLVDPDSYSTLPVGAPSAAPAYPRELRAFRLSSRPGSPLHNVYLAGPLTLHRTLGSDQAAAMINQLPRTMLAANKCLVVGLAPGGGASMLDPFRAQISGDSIRPGAHAIVPIDYVRNPVIFVHGVMASTLASGATTDLTDLWVPLFQGLVSQNLDALFNTAIQSFFGTSLNVSVLSGLNKLVLDKDGMGLDVFPTDILRSVTIFDIDIQGDFLEFMRDDLGYREYVWDYKGVNEAALRIDGSPDWSSLETLPDLFPFPYDWRKDNATSADRLAKYVELIKASNPDVEHVDIVAHSMGGLVSRRFMLDHPGEVENFISIASPFLGATKAVATMTNGDLGDFFLNLLLPEELSRKVARHMPALHQLMPSEALFDLGFHPVAEAGWDTDGDGDMNGEIEYSGYSKFLDEVLFPALGEDDPEPIKNNDNFHAFRKEESPGNNQDDWSADPSGTRFFHIVGVQQSPKTISRLEFTPSVVPDPNPQPLLFLSFPPVDFEDSEQLDSDDPILSDDAPLSVQGDAYRLMRAMRIRHGAGDQTVPLLSATRGYGAGAGRDLNAPGAVMVPIVSRSTGATDEKAVSHVPLMQNPQMFGLVKRILSSGLEKSELPTLKLPSATVSEGELLDTQVELIGNLPAGTPVIVWDAGDGTMGRGELILHRYARDGNYTLTACVFYPDSGIGNVVSAAITVINAPPQVAIDVFPASVGRGEATTITALVDDPGKADGHRYEWFMDGEPVEGAEGSSFLLRRSFFTTGERLFEVKVTDDDGAVATAGATLTVTDSPIPVPAPPAGGPAEGDPVDDEEFVDLTITGHETGLVSARVFQDGTPLLSITGIFRELRSLASGLNAAGDETLRIIRAPAAPGGSEPSKCTVRTNAAGDRVKFNLKLASGSGELRAYYWEVAATPGEEVSLAFDWADIGALNEGALASMTSPTAVKAFITPFFAGTDPAVAMDVDQGRGTLTFTSRDRTVVDGDPEADLTEQGVAVIDPTIVGGIPDCNELEGAAVTIFDQAPLSRSQVPTSSRALLGIAGNGDASLLTEIGGGATAKATQVELNKAREAIGKAVTAGVESNDFKRFTLGMEDVLLFEQGTGACLWKNNDDKCAYIPKTSDNDYEIFMPVFKKPLAGMSTLFDFDNPDHAAAFARIAHLPKIMRGDWYFKPPIGVDASGREMGPLPDFADGEEFNEYVFIAKSWRYYLPEGETTTLAGTVISGPNGSFFDITKGDSPSPDPDVDALFDNPVTPAEAIAFVFTDVVKTDPSISATLPDISFFPFRKEHFFFGVPSIEKPPPFGDDPLGDAGMGRGLLFLKWVLEGAFVPVDFAGGLNVGIDDLATRVEIFDRMAARKDRFAGDGYEWGTYQEFALLKDSAHLRMEPDISGAEPCPQVFADYLTAHDDKTMRKAGKSAIRAILGRLVDDPTARIQVFDTDPLEFEANPDLPTFEDFIASVAVQHTGLLGLNADEIETFRDAKLGNDPEVYQRIRRSPGGVDGFITRTFDVLRLNVQQPTAQGYVEFLGNLMDDGRIDEFAARFENAVAIDRGFTTNTGSKQVGRTALFGLEGNAEAKYSFIVTLQSRRQQNTIGPFSVKLATSFDELNMPEVVLECPGLTIPPEERTLTLSHKNASDKPFFTIKHPIAGGGIEKHSFSVSGATATPANFVSHLLSPGTFFHPSFASRPGTRWVFRGVNLTDAQMQVLRSNELEAGVLDSAARRNGVDFASRRDQLAVDLDADLTPTPGDPDPMVFDFTHTDSLLWSNEQKAALRHTSGTPPNSVCVSTTEDMAIAEIFSGTGIEKNWIIALEVPLDQGLEYLPTANGAPRRINVEENEVVYLDRIRFARAHLFSIVPDTLVPGAAIFTLVETYTGTP